MSSPYIVFGAPSLGEEEIAEVVDCLRSNWIGTGPRVARFERDFASYKSIPSTQVAAVNSCTAALHISLLAANLDPGAEVITTPLTFCATVNAIAHAGLKPVLADVNPDTQCIDPDAIAAAITDRTQAILPVHFAGRPCAMDRIMSMARDRGLVVIEDCAHAIETQFRGKHAGTFGDFGCFSFYATKNVVTGEGGMIIGQDAAQIARARVLALHGMSKDAWHRYSDAGFKHYQVVESGFKYNMMDLQAAIGIHQLARVEHNWLRRRDIWQRYLAEFADLPIKLPGPDEVGTRHGYHLFTIGIGGESSVISRDDFLNAMHRQGIGTGVHYLAIPEHEHYRMQYGWTTAEYPSATHIGRTTASLPLSPGLSDDDVTRVIATVRTTILG